MKSDDKTSARTSLQTSDKKLAPRARLLGVIHDKLHSLFTRQVTP